MGTTTGIAWTDSTFNPWVGCQRVSPGCVHCYAEAQDHRWRPGKERWGPTAERTRTSPANWRKPLQWNARATKLRIRHRVFCSSLADVFEDRPEIAPWRSDLFDLIAATPMLDWQLLTKRPENIARLMPSVTGYEPDAWGKNAGQVVGVRVGDRLAWPNVWIRTTVEDQQRANERIPHLIAVPAVVRFLSCEPLLEDLDLGRWLDEELTGFVHYIDWVIIGGESGPKARSFHLDWARSLIIQCQDGGRAAAAPFVKQMGDNAVASGRDQFSLLAMKAHHGTDPSEWPIDLRVQEFPEARR